MTFSTLGTDTTTHQPVYLYKASRRQGTYFIAATGVGKSTSLRHLILEDIKQGTGVCIFDPHGDLIDEIIGSLKNPEDRKRVILLDATDENRVFGINLYQCDNPSSRQAVEDTYERVYHLLELLWPDIHTHALIMQGMRNSTYALIESGYGMLELPLLFAPSHTPPKNTPRTNILSNVRNQAIRDNWSDFEVFDERVQAERANMVVNKFEDYTINPLIRPIIGQSKSTIDFREVIDSRDGKIVLVKLDRRKKRLTQLIGTMVIAQLVLAAYARQGSENRRQFHIYCDEFEIYATDDFTSLLKECRKYAIGMTIAHQSREDLTQTNKAASLQVANIIVGRLIPDDAKDIAGMFDTSPGTVETREEQVKAITTNPVEWFRQGKGHKDWRVVELVSKLITPLFVEIGKYTVPAYFEAERLSKRSFWTIFELLDTINRFLVHAMHGASLQSPEFEQQTVEYWDSTEKERRYTEVVERKKRLITQRDTVPDLLRDVGFNSEAAYKTYLLNFSSNNDYIPQDRQFYSFYPDLRNVRPDNPLVKEVPSAQDDAALAVRQGEKQERFYTLSPSLLSPAEKRLRDLIATSWEEEKTECAPELLGRMQKAMQDLGVFRFTPVVYTQAEIQAVEKKEEEKIFQQAVVKRRCAKFLLIPVCLIVLVLCVAAEIWIVKEIISLLTSPEWGLWGLLLMVGFSIFTLAVVLFPIVIGGVILGYSIAYWRKENYKNYYDLPGSTFADDRMTETSAMRNSVKKQRDTFLYKSVEVEDVGFWQYPRSSHILTWLKSELALIETWETEIAELEKQEKELLAYRKTKVIPVAIPNKQQLLIADILWGVSNYLIKKFVPSKLSPNKPAWFERGLPESIGLLSVDFYPYYGEIENLHLLYPTEDDMDNALAAFAASYQGNGYFPDEAKQALKQIRYVYHLKKSLVRDNRLKDYKKILRLTLEGIPIPNAESERIREAWGQAETDFARITTLVVDWVELAQLLQDDPIRVASGQYEEKEIKQGQADRKLEIENELVHQPNKIARCRVQNEKGDLEEHTIQLEASKIPVAEKSKREQWIEEIKNRMLNKDKTLRLTTDVEQEIAQRQAKLRQPAQLQKAELQPLQRRYAVGSEAAQPLQPAASDSQLEQEIAALTPERWQQDIKDGLIDDTVTYAAWYTQEVKKLLKQG